MSLVLDVRGPRLPRIVHWGRRIASHEDVDLAHLVSAGARGRDAFRTDSRLEPSVAPQYADGWPGRPAVLGARRGTAFAPDFKVERIESGVSATDSDSVTVHARDAHAALGLRIDMEMFASGLVRTRSTLQNFGDSSYQLESLECVLPVPREADEILDFTGRWAREREPQRHAFTVGAHVREVRLGRSLDGSSLIAVGSAGFGWEHGRVWAAHVGWSGNTRLYAEQVMPSGDRVIGGGELLLPGEIDISAGDEYSSPWLYLASAEGLNGVAAQFHGFLRQLPSHPSSERKTTLNVWEAVYFDHDLARLTDLVDRGAAVGVERFVLDDGWFLGRRNEKAGLGDWYVDESVWPGGLHPLIERVHAAGMEFGLWFEPEMVNPDSDLARSHPEWVLQVPGRLPATSRSQWVLDLGNSHAWDYILERIDALLSEYPIAYVKWDHNRDLVDAASQQTGRPGVHAQTVALYRLIDEVRRRHPGVEIESCASGGGRIDLGIMERCQRVWASDTNDPLERSRIQEGTALLLPPEMIGSHIAAPRSHTTERRHDLAFRAATSLFGHLGIEWDITEADESELAELSLWVAAYRELRPLLHGGRAVTVDTADRAVRVHGVVSVDRTDAVFAIAQLATSVAASSGRLRIPGLRPDRHYSIEPVGTPGGISKRSAGTWWPGPLILSGEHLGIVGLEAPPQRPEHSVLIRLKAVPLVTST